MEARTLCNLRLRFDRQRQRRVPGVWDGDRAEDAADGGEIAGALKRQPRGRLQPTGQCPQFQLGVGDSPFLFSGAGFQPAFSGVDSVAG
jgi:hypothetical protein